MRLEEDGSIPVAVFETVVRQDKTRSGSTLSARASAVVDGSPARDLPDSADSPTVVSIQGLDLDLRSEGGFVEIAEREGRFEIRVACSPDFAVTASAEVLTKST